MELFRLIAACLLIITVSGVSNGNLPVCSVDMAIGNGTNVMKWVQAPVSNNVKYTISTTAGKTSYHPGALTPITITVTDLAYVYIGLLLVAEVNGVNATSHVGQWTVLDGDDFFLPATCKFQAVVHANAELKKLSHTFFWKGDVGTGTVKIRALIKQGEQNHGNFYKPDDLTLTEDTPLAANSQKVFKSAPGASCSDTCAKQNMACDSASTLQLSTSAALLAGVQDFYACRQPLLRTCGPPATGTNSYCYYYGCTASQTFVPISTCSRKIGDPTMNQAFCACKAGTPVPDPQPSLYAVNSSIGFRLPNPVQLDAELTINSIEMQGDEVTVDLSGPQDKWFAIGWDAQYMEGTYATVVWLNNPAIKPPQDYSTFWDLGYVDYAQGWYDLKCQQALNDYCRNVGDYVNRQFQCCPANTTIQNTDPTMYNFSNVSRVPCKNGKVSPYLPMTVGEYRLTASPKRGFTTLPTTITPIRSLVEGGQFRISFTRSVSAANITGASPFPYKKSINIIWSMGRQQYFGAPFGSTQAIKHLKKSETQVTLSLVPIYPVCLSSSITTLPSMLLLGGLAALGSKNWVLGALLAVLIRPASAHNWVNTQSRAQIAAVSVPCQERVDPAPHLQVAPGQSFQMEWSTGHGDTPTAWTYWVFLKEASYNYLIDIQDSDLDDYLDKAPAGSVLTGDQWARRHLAPLAHETCPTPPCTWNLGGAGIFQSKLTTTDPRYVVRNPVSVAKSLMSYDQNVQQYWYLPSETGGDKRAQYQSDKYPWIISVHKFKVPAHWPDEYDMATFTFPNVADAGNYIAHFKWGGYRDCTDVNILNVPVVQNPWGLVQSANLSSTFVRLDHCEYTFVLNPSTRCRVMNSTDATQCLNECLKLDGTYGCTGVQAVLKKNPAGTLPWVPNYPYKQYTPVAAGNNIFPHPEYGPCDSRTIQKRDPCPDSSTMCNDNDLASANDNSYICYGLTPYRDQDFQTTEDWVIATDPQDPKFYSSCWVRLAPGGFLPSPVPVKPPVVWQTGKRCLNCDWINNTYTNLHLNYTPRWTDALTDDCAQCDTLAAPGCNADITYVEGGDPGTCATATSNGGTCSISCDSGFNLFGDKRECNDGLLFGTEQKCVFKGC